MLSLVKKKVDLIDSVDYFMRNDAPFASTISFSGRSRFVILHHKVNEFVLKIYCYKEQFGHLIDQYVNNVIREIKVNKKVNDAGWDNQVVFVDRIEQTPDYFESAAF